MGQVPDMGLMSALQARGVGGWVSVLGGRAPAASRLACAHDAPPPPCAPPLAFTPLPPRAPHACMHAVAAARPALHAAAQLGAGGAAVGERDLIITDMFNTQPGAAAVAGGGGGNPALRAPATQPLFASTAQSAVPPVSACFRIRHVIGVQQRRATCVKRVWGRSYVKRIGMKKAGVCVGGGGTLCGAWAVGGCQPRPRRATGVAARLHTRCFKYLKAFSRG